MTRIFIVEDHPVMRQSLVAFLKRQEGIDLCGEAATAEVALREIEKIQPDMVLIDVSLPGMSGLDLLEQIHHRQPEILCVVLSGHGERSHVDRALLAGARGYILKGDTDELASGLRQIIGGGTYLSDQVQGLVSGSADDDNSASDGSSE